jgi:hypothetical protein
MPVDAIELAKRARLGMRGSVSVAGHRDREQDHKNILRIRRMPVYTESRRLRMTRMSRNCPIIIVAMTPEGSHGFV